MADSRELRRWQQQLGEIVAGVRVAFPDSVGSAAVEAVRRVVPGVIDRHYTVRPRCLQSTRVGLEVLRDLGVTAQPLVTVALTLAQAWKPGDWLPPAPDKSGYHLVLRVDGCLLDLDARSLTLPSTTVPTTLLLPWADRAAWCLLPGGGLVGYRQQPGRPYLATREWTLASKAVSEARLLARTELETA